MCLICVELLTSRMKHDEAQRAIGEIKSDKTPLREMPIVKTAEHLEVVEDLIRRLADMQEKL